jgi:hypothetical protein
MTAKIVCRLLDSQGKLLGWEEHYAAVRGDGSLRASKQVIIPIELAGRAKEISLHWCEVNVETRVPAPDLDVKVGEQILIFQTNMQMVVLGRPPIGLPPVTVGRSIGIGIPAGQLGASGLIM